MRYRTLIVAMVALIVLAGCSKTSPTPTGGTAAKPADAGAPAKAGTVDPCALITTAEATAALGKPAKDGAAHSSQSTRQCQWDAADGAGSLAILVWLGGQKGSWSSNHDLAKTAYSAKFRDIPGLGDAAFSNGFDVHILKGDDMYQIGVIGVQDNVDRAVAVAKQALARV